VLAGLAIMCASMLLRAGAWTALLRAALPAVRVRFADAWQGTAIGVLMSATLPARLGEPARALIVARRLGQPRERLPVVLGTLVGQTLINVAALVVLGAGFLHGVGLFDGRGHVLAWYAIAPVAVAAAVILLPSLPRVRGQWRSLLARTRSGLAVLHDPRRGAIAVGAQLGAWVLQWLSCYVLLVALGLDDRAGLSAAAAVLFAVNVSAVLPVTPSNLGVFQAACVAVLTGAYGVHAGDALAYGIVLQCVEVATAVIMGAPALVREGLSWRDVRHRTLYATPVRIAPRPGPTQPDEAR
jgi:phosphatidylinositol alpha-mannosyltransferase